MNIVYRLLLFVVWRGLDPFVDVFCCDAGVLFPCLLVCYGSVYVSGCLSAFFSCDVLGVFQYGVVYCATDLTAQVIGIR